MTIELKGNVLHDMHKLLYLANEYPTKTIQGVGKLFHLSVLDLNAAIWRAQDYNYLTVNEDSKFTVDRVPDKWEFGTEVETVMENVTYTLTRLAKEEADLLEIYLNNWAEGISPHDYLVAMKKLLSDRVIASYEIKDTVPVKGTVGKKGKTREEIYTFYTLFENLEHRWGTKQFKNQESLK